MTIQVFYVTQGAVRLFVEDLEGEQHEKLLVPGDFGFVPKNCAHAYRMERHHSVIVGVAAGPGGTFERFFENLGTPSDELGLPERPGRPRRLRAGDRREPPVGRARRGGRGALLHPHARLRHPPLRVTARPAAARAARPPGPRRRPEDNPLGTRPSEEP